MSAAKELPETPERSDAPRRAAWSAPMLRSLSAMEAEFGPNSVTEGPVLTS